LKEAIISINAVTDRHTFRLTDGRKESLCPIISSTDEDISKRNEDEGSVNFLASLQVSRGIPPISPLTSRDCHHENLASQDSV
jgi:hypothetical protein